MLRKRNQESHLNLNIDNYKLKRAIKKREIIFFSSTICLNLFFIIEKKKVNVKFCRLDNIFCVQTIVFRDTTFETQSVGSWYLRAHTFTRFARGETLLSCVICTIWCSLTSSIYWIHNRPGLTEVNSHIYARVLIFLLLSILPRRIVTMTSQLLARLR